MVHFEIFINSVNLKNDKKYGQRWYKLDTERFTLEERRYQQLSEEMGWFLSEEDV